MSDFTWKIVWTQRCQGQGRATFINYHVYLQAYPDRINFALYVWLYISNKKGKAAPEVNVHGFYNTRIKDMCMCPRVLANMANVSLLLCSPSSVWISNVITHVPTPSQDRCDKAKTHPQPFSWPKSWHHHLFCEDWGVLGLPKCCLGLGLIKTSRDAVIYIRGREAVLYT